MINFVKHLVDPIILEVQQQQHIYSNPLTVVKLLKDVVVVLLKLWDLLNVSQD